MSLIPRPFHEVITSQSGHREMKKWVNSRRKSTVHAHQTANPAVPNPQPQFLQLFGHARSTIAMKAETVLFTDMGQDHHIIALTLAHRTHPPRTQPTRCDPHNPAQKFD
jgi:hypothetical protein